MSQTKYYEVKYKRIVNGETRYMTKIAHVTEGYSTKKDIPKMIQLADKYFDEIESIKEVDKPKDKGPWTNRGRK